MIGSYARWTWFAVAFLLAGCVGVAPLPPPDDGPRNRTIQVFSNGWHTAIVVPRAEIAATEALPEIDDFPHAGVLEFGWGDRAYYPARRKTVGMTLAAALLPTRAVMHVVGLPRPPAADRQGSEVLSLALTRLEVRRLAHALAADFERPAGESARPISRGLYPDSYFYDARGTFHIFNTCNTWTARMLRAAGIPLSPFGVITADELMARLRRAIGLRDDWRIAR